MREQVPSSKQCEQDQKMKKLFDAHVISKKDVKENVRNTARHPYNVYKDFVQIQRFKKNLALIRSSLSTSDVGIPKTFHFVLLTKTRQDIPYYMLMAIATALHHNPDYKVVLHTNNEPNGTNWSKISGHVQVSLFSDFDYFGVARLYHPAHKSDVIRLLALREIGGIYLDNDTLTVNSFDPLLQNEFVMGVQGRTHSSGPKLCNAVLMSKYRSEFSQLLCASYKAFRSKGYDENWDYHSGQLPKVLSWYYPELVRIIPYNRFFYPLWPSVNEIIFKEGSNKYIPYLNESYCIHLWHSQAQEYITKLNSDFVKESSSAYAEFARPALSLFERQKAEDPIQEQSVPARQARRPRNHRTRSDKVNEVN